MSSILNAKIAPKENISNPDTFFDNNYFLSGGTNLIGKKQDKVFVGTNELFKWIVVLDGHGKGKVVEKLGKIDWNSLLYNFNDPKKLMNQINLYLCYEIDGSLQKNIGDGTTCSIVKIYKDKIIIHWIGDSDVGVKINQDIYFMDIHNNFNNYELERLADENISSLPSWTPRVLDGEYNITMVPGRYFDHPYRYPLDTSDKYYVEESMRYKKRDRLSMTRALGHNDGLTFATLQKFDTKKFDITSTDKISIIAATDGLWDVLNETNKNALFEQALNHYEYNKNPVHQLLQKAEFLWNIDWNYYSPKELNKPPDDPVKQKMFSCDDIAIAIYLKF